MTYLRILLSLVALVFGPTFLITFAITGSLLASSLLAIGLLAPWIAAGLAAEAYFAQRLKSSSDVDPALALLLDKALDRLEQASLQCLGSRGHVIQNREILLRVFNTTGAWVIPLRGVLSRRNTLFVSSGALLRLDRSGLEELLVQSLLMFEDRELSARCWAATLIDLFTRRTGNLSVDLILGDRLAVQNLAIHRVLLPWVVFSDWLLFPWIGFWLDVASKSATSGMRERLRAVSPDGVLLVSDGDTVARSMMAQNRVEELPAGIRAFLSAMTALPSSSRQVN